VLSLRERRDNSIGFKSKLVNILGEVSELVYDLVSVGHLVIDSIFLPDRKTPFVVLGGAVAYVSLAARHLNARVSVVSKIGHDFPEAYLWRLRKEGIDLSNVLREDKGTTTRFELRYDEDFSHRSLRSGSRMSPITVEEIVHLPTALAIHVGPVAGEITNELVEKLKGCCKIMSFDPQGLVRRFDRDGNVSIGPLIDKRVLEHVDIFKSSFEEIQAITGFGELDQTVRAIHDHGVSIVIVTLGEKGAAVSVEGTMHNVPAFKPAKLVDPTGAGDVFIGGFLTEYVHGEDGLWCSCVGAAAASLVVEAVGPSYFGDREEIYRRARFLYEKGIKE
jgi:sugar/nucleoside kinase (ribokinase family)